MNDFSIKLKDLLAKEVQFALKLYELIKQERIILENQNTLDLSENTHLKEQCFQKLQATSKSRVQWMKMHGLSWSNFQELKEQLAIHTLGTEFFGLFESLREVSDACENENRVNGQLINRQNQFFQQVKNMIFNNQSTSGDTTYNARGKTLAANHSNNIQNI